MSPPKSAPRSLPSLPSSFGGAFCPVTLLTTSWVLAHDVISPIPPLCICVRVDIRGSLRGRRRKGSGSVHCFPVARHRTCRHASFTRRRRPRDGVYGSCDVLVRMGGDGCTRSTDGGPCYRVVTRTFGATLLVGMGVANSCAFDDRLRLSHSALVLALTSAMGHSRRFAGRQGTSGLSPTPDTCCTRIGRRDGPCAELISINYKASFSAHRCGASCPSRGRETARIGT